MADNNATPGEGGQRTRRGRGGGGADARRAKRVGVSAPQASYITRAIPTFEIMNEEALCLIEANADTVLEEIGLDFRDDPEVLEMWKELV